MLDVSEIADSLDLRSYARLLRTGHPFFAQIKNLINSSNFFDIKINFAVDKKVKKSLELLNKERRKVLQWPVNVVCASPQLTTALLNTELKNLLTRAGKASLPYFMINRRYPNACITQLNQRELRSVERFLIYPELANILLAVAGLPFIINANVEPAEMLPTNTKCIANITAMSSKQLRLSQTNESDKLICLYKLGLALTPGEVAAWTNKLRKLTSTRHRNILLRAAHGDIFSNSRLFRFGLRDNPKCANCQEAMETILHRICECPLALETWNKLEEAKRELGLRCLTDLTIENLMGAKDKLSKIELALNAELILKITSKGEGYSSSQLVRSTLQLIGNSERMNQDLRNKFRTVTNQQRN